MKKMYHLKMCIVFAVLFVMGAVFCGSDTVKADTEGLWEYWKGSDNKVTITGYSGAERDVQIPDTIQGAEVVAINGSCFADNTRMQSVFIPDTVTVVGGYAFQNCTSLVQVTGMANVTTIGSYAFEGDKELNEVTLGSVLIEIGDGAFSGCSSLTECVLPDSLKKLGYQCFYRSGLTQVKIPATVWSSGSVFGDCTALERVEIGKDSNISGSMFSGCTLLTAVEIEAEGISSIESYAFQDCKSLSNIIIPKSVRSIGSYAFNGCAALKKVDLFYGLLEIGSSAFSGDSALSEIQIPNSVITIGAQAFARCSSLESIVVPHSVTSMRSAFYDNYGTTIQYYPGSAAESYVKENNFTGKELPEVPSEDLKFDKDTEEVEVGAVLQLSYNITPPVGETTDAIIWESMDSNIASVNGIGEVTGERAGSQVQIIATTTSGIEDVINVFVVDRPESVSVWLSESRIREGASATLTAEVRNTSWGVLEGCEVDFSISDPTVASISEEGVVTGLKAGTATITAKVRDREITDTCDITVVSGQIVSVTMSKSRMSLQAGRTASRTATVRDAIGIRTDVKPTYSSSNTNVATVDTNGLVTAKHAGNATITARVGNLTASYPVVVSGSNPGGSTGENDNDNNANQPTAVTFANTSKATILIGKTTTRKATVSGSSIAPTYTSSNKKIAKVSSSGKVTGVKAGTVTITAKAGNYSASYKVTVVMAKLSKSGKTLTITTLPKAKVTVKASKSILGKSSKKATANSKGVVKMKFKKKIKGTVKVTIEKKGYKKKTISKKF